MTDINCYKGSISGLRPRNVLTIHVSSFIFHTRTYFTCDKRKKREEWNEEGRSKQIRYLFNYLIHFRTFKSVFILYIAFERRLYLQSSYPSNYREYRVIRGNNGLLIKNGGNDRTRIVGLLGVSDTGRTIGLANQTV